jgi:hypothetical protein
VPSDHSALLSPVIASHSPFLEDQIYSSGHTKRRILREDTEGGMIEQRTLGCYTGLRRGREQKVSRA